MSKYSKFWPQGGLPGILHHYTETLVTFEYTSSTTARQPHSLLFIGGLGDGLATTSYTADLVRALAPTGWSFFTINLTSAGQAWGVGSLDRDTDEVAQCVRYISEYKAAKYGTTTTTGQETTSSSSSNKVVLMGHSTGSQCVLHYLCRPNPHTSTPSFDPHLEHAVRPPVDGAIMQAPVSDREAMGWVLRHGIGDRPAASCREAYAAMEELAKDAARRRELDGAMLPLALTGRIYPPNTPISCRRFLSLVSPDGPDAPGEDDLFSSDLGDEQLAGTFGAVHPGGLLRHKLMVLHSGADQSVPDHVDKERLLARWADIADRNGECQVWDREHSGVIPDASHALSNDDQAEPRQWLCRRVLSYLDTALEVKN